MKVCLREAQPQDLLLTFNIKENALSTYVDQIWGWEKKAQWQFHQERFTPKHIQIIERLGMAVGYLEKRQTPEHIFIANLLIHPQAQSQGIGSWVMRSVISESEQKQLDLQLEVFRINERAQEFYLRHNFQVWKKTNIKLMMQRTWA